MGSCCSFIGEHDSSCGGHAILVPSHCSRRAFVGCSNWIPGSLLTKKGGQMGLASHPRVAADRTTRLWFYRTTSRRRCQIQSGSWTPTLLLKWLPRALPKKALRLKPFVTQASRLLIGIIFSIIHAFWHRAGEGICSLSWIWAGTISLRFDAQPTMRRRGMYRD